jgi:hypothetical protein
LQVAVAYWSSDVNQSDLPVTLGATAGARLFGAVAAAATMLS